ncbi:MAG: hypothetical protein NC302_02935 [Bacteroidales bacterium]|nr:hypothetical protein [Bacteroidales bacterium]MCM1415103.1 hypothetical protein [bacterium]MCM1423959.1 hypothetical protein [bacterium]
MGFIKKLLDRFRRDYEEYDEEWDEEEAPREIDFNNRDQRNDYVRNCLEKMAEATKELENLNFEYNMVTSYLKDMEEIEALPPEESEQLKDCARRVSLLQDKKTDFMGRPRRITDEKYRQIERMEDEVEEGISKLKEAEDYRDLIRKDLSRLDGERHAYLYRKNEVMRLLSDTRGMAVICVAALALCALLLLFLQYFLEMDTRIGYLLTAGAAAVMLTLIYVRHTDARRELKRVETGINKIILLQNKVKIRYVNNTNLLEYLYMKYGVSSMQELSQLWENYRIEKEEREKFRRAELDLDYSEQELLQILKCYQVQDPAIWLHQTEAILDPKEMVEIRHNLIIRRQSLRRRMDYNREVVAGTSQKDIKALVERYPKYAKEIMQTVEEYEQKFNTKS